MIAGTARGAAAVVASVTESHVLPTGETVHTHQYTIYHPTEDGDTIAEPVRGVEAWVSGAVTTAHVVADSRADALEMLATRVEMLARQLRAMADRAHAAGYRARHCGTCGRLDHRPQDHAGWDPTREGHG